MYFNVLMNRAHKSLAWPPEKECASTTVTLNVLNELDEDNSSFLESNGQ